jgi:O-antigen ligase
LLFWAIRRRLRHRNDLMPPAIILAYPAIVLFTLAASFVIKKIKYAVWGGGETLDSNAARIEQYSSGIPKILSHPWGYGIGRAAEVLGYREPSGMLTIDTYYLSTALEYGIIGFLLFFGFFIVITYKGTSIIFKDVDLDRDTAFILPATTAIINFVVIKSVFNQEDNHPLVFMIAGMLGALLYRSASTKPSSDPQAIVG